MRLHSRRIRLARRSHSARAARHLRHNSLWPDFMVVPNCVLLPGYCWAEVGLPAAPEQDAVRTVRGKTPASLDMHQGRRPTSSCEHPAIPGRYDVH